jgi:hypothetical protein
MIFDLVESDDVALVRFLEGLKLSLASVVRRSEFVELLLEWRVIEWAQWHGRRIDWK